jgi:hypothetical protein
MGGFRNRPQAAEFWKKPFILPVWDESVCADQQTCTLWALD